MISEAPLGPDSSSSPHSSGSSLHSQRPAAAAQRGDGADPGIIPAARRPQRSCGASTRAAGPAPAGPRASATRATGSELGLAKRRAEGTGAAPGRAEGRGGTAGGTSGGRGLADRKYSGRLGGRGGAGAGPSDPDVISGGRARRWSEDVEARKASALRGRPPWVRGGAARELHGRGVAGRCLGGARGLAARPGCGGEGLPLRFVTVSTEFGDAPRDSEELTGPGAGSGDPSPVAKRFLVCRRLLLIVTVVEEAASAKGACSQR